MDTREMQRANAEIGLADLAYCLERTTQSPSVRIAKLMLPALMAALGGAALILLL